jgi:hypothetical protein
MWRRVSSSVTPANKLTLNIADISAKPRKDGGAMDISGKLSAPGVARGGDDYATFAAADQVVPVEDTPLLADEVMIYLLRLGRITSRIEGRMSLK